MHHRPAEQARLHHSGAPINERTITPPRRSSRRLQRRHSLIKIDIQERANLPIGFPKPIQPVPVWAVTHAQK